MSVDWTPARPPAREPIEGKLVRLEPVDAERHAEPLFTASHGERGDPHIWDYLGYGPFVDVAEFTRWLQGSAASDDPLFFAVVDRGSMQPRGMASFMRIAPAHGVIEIGHIWFAPVLQRTRQATEAIYLMARHAFDDLGYRRLEWKCDSLNAPSRRAAERFGFIFEGIFRQHMVVKGRNRDTAWFSILDTEWPRVRAGFDAWLSPDNFELGGRQRQSLANLRARIGAAE